MKKAKLKKVIERLSEYYGKPFDHSKRKPEILDVLIATKLAQSTTDKSAFVAFKNLKRRFGSWEKIPEAALSELKDEIKVCGLANTKARNIKEMLSSMKKKHGSLDISFIRKLDDEKVYEELLGYDGIGVKTISCVLIFALGRDAFPVDTHVHRVLNRLGIVKTNSPVKTFEEVRNEIPEGKKYELHTDLIKFGRNICRAKIPLCGICFLYDLCEFPEKKFYRKKETPELTENNFIILEHI